MYKLITDALSTVLKWFGLVIDSLTTPAGDGTAAGALYSLMPVLVIAVAISLVLLTIKIVRKVCWGA